MSNPVFNVFPTPRLPLPRDQTAKPSSLPKERISMTPTKDPEKKTRKFSTRYIFGWIIIASLIFAAVGAWANSLRAIAGNFITMSKDGLKGGKAKDDPKKGSGHKKNSGERDPNSPDLGTELPIAIFFSVAVVIAIYVINPQR